MSTERRTHLLAGLLALAAAIPATSQAQLGGEGLPDLSGVAGAITGSVAPKSSGTFTSGLTVPSVHPGAAAKGIGHQLRTTIEAKTGKNAALQALEDGMPETLTKIESGLQGLGLAKRDLGVAVGYFFVTTYETATGKTVPQDASVAAGRTIAKAVGQRWAARFKGLSPEKRESMYETLLITPTLLSAFATQFDKAGKGQEAQGMRQASATLFEKLIGTAPSSVTIDAKGMISGLAGGTASVRPATKGTRTASKNRPSTRPGTPELPVGGLTPASLNGAKVYIRYSMPDGISGPASTFHELVMFPDGSAFDGLPDDPLPRFDAATIRKYSRKYDIGTWKQSGSKLTLTFNGKPETYVKHNSGGWADPENASGSYNIYFPVKPLTKAQLVGAWKHKSLSTMGMAGGGTPMVAAGSNNDLTFAANGTFVKAGTRFASATTSNMGDAFKSGNVTTSSTGNSAGKGQWRLDGPLLTTVENGRRGVQLAYVLPHWNKATEPPQLMIRGDWWFRPGQGF